MQINGGIFYFIQRLRLIIIWQNVDYAWQSTNGKLVVAQEGWSDFSTQPALLSVVQTCHRQGDSVVDFFEKSLVVLTSKELSSNMSLIPTSYTSTLPSRRFLEVTDLDLGSDRSHLNPYK